MNCKLILLLALFAAATTVRGELPEGATILDPNIVWDPVSVDSAAISPNGAMIAYVSKGAIWMCRVTSGPPTKLTDLPDTITALLAMPENQSAREKFGYVAPNPSYRPLPHLRGEILQFFTLQWTPSQDGVVYTLRRRLKDNSSLAAYRVMHVSLNGVATQIALIERSFTATPDSFTTFRVTPNRKHVIVSNFRHPLIWDAATNKPRATCFDFLLPSSTSGRFLGIEIDTRELVLADENFRITKRFNVRLDQRRGCDLFWSPDERVAICRTFRSSVEPISNHCTFFRVNLETGERSESKKGIEGDKFYFSGRGSEVIRVGMTGTPQGGYGDGSNGTFIEMIPNGDEPARDIVRFSRLPQPTDDYRDHRWYPAVISNADCTLFAIALPREAGKRRGYHYHLVDRQGKTWPFAPIDDSLYYTPYFPIAFANNGQAIVARSASQLFSIPVQTVQRNKEGER
jgi:hypothetical protein